MSTYGVDLPCFYKWTSSTHGLLPCNSYLRVLALLGNFFMKGSSQGDMLLTFWGPLRGMPLLVVVYNGTPYGAPAMGDIPQEDVT